jgi:hypothetical protein
MAGSWPLSPATLDRVESYVGDRAARQYVRYFRAKVVVRAGYLAILLVSLAGIIWRRHVSAQALIIFDLVGAGVLVTLLQASVIYTVNVFAHSLQMPFRRGWSIPLFRAQSLIDWLAEHATERAR